MKNSNEMLDSLFERREQYNNEKKRRNKMVFRTGMSLCCVCVAVMVGVLLIKSNGAKPALADKNSSEITDDIKNTAIVPFESTLNDPQSDAFGQDELHHIDVIIDNSRVYRQLSVDEYEGYGFNKQLSSDDFGEYLGTVVEISKSEPSIAIAAKEPTLAGSRVYYYAKTAKATIIVKNDINCGLFVFDTPGICGEEIYEIFGATSADDISYLSYNIHGLLGIEYKKVEEGIIKSERKIKTFYNITSKLIPYEVPSGISATPQWYNDAWEVYNKAPENFLREDITINIHFKNGTVLKDLIYQPYLATGYVDGMELLTETQNQDLRNAIKAD